MLKDYEIPPKYGRRTGKYVLLFIVVYSCILIGREPTVNFPRFHSDKINIQKSAKVAKRVFLDYLGKKKLAEPTKRQHWRSVRIFYVEARERVVIMSTF